MLIKSTIFHNCTNNMFSGVLDFDDCHNITMINCSVKDVDTDSGGGVLKLILSDGFVVDVENCSFVNCSAAFQGGAFNLMGEYSETNSYTIIFNQSVFDHCFVLLNDTRGYSYGGGAIFIEGMINPTGVYFGCNFSNCYVTNNGSGATNGYGGAMYFSSSHPELSLKMIFLFSFFYL